MREPYKNRGSGRLDSLPPHAPESERGVLGCILLDPARALPVCVELFGPAASRVFYELPHQLIYQALVAVQEEAGTVDVILLQQRLKDADRLEQVGGLDYLARLPDAVPSAANVKYYADIVFEKFALRDMVRELTEGRLKVGEHQGEVQPLLATIAEKVARVVEVFGARDRSKAPKYLARPAEFAEEACAKWFRDAELGEPGLELPIGFPLKIRRGESTLVSADNGAGKSTLLSYLALHLAAQDPGVCVASFEEKPSDSLWRLGSQLVGAKALPDSDAGRRKASLAMGWLHQRFWFYNFLGISDWRTVLETFRYAARVHGVWLFILDSVMRIGIADDDYAQQGLAAAAFANFPMEYNAHLMHVIHENKGEGKGKSRIRGSKQWSDNANNIITVQRNEKKGTEVDKLIWELDREKKAADPDAGELGRLEKEVEEKKREWDTALFLHKQRYSGSRQNGSRYFWFDRENFQFRGHWEDAPVNWLERWKRREGARAEGQTTGEDVEA